MIDAAVGVIERGRARIDDLVAEQPWLPRGPVPFEVTWRRPGYQRIRHGQQANRHTQAGQGVHTSR